MSDGDQLERLTALMAQQPEQAAQREEWLASMLERALASQEQQLVTRSDAAVAEGGQSAGAESGRSAGRSAGTVATAALSARLPAGTITAPHLTSSASLKEFGVWRQKFTDFKLLTRLEALPEKEQRAALMSLLDDDWTRTLRYSLPIAPNAALDTILDTMESHLRGQRSIVLDRRDFYSRVQEPDEAFDDFVSSVKEIAAYCDFCDACIDDQYRDRSVVGTRDEEALKRMLLEPKMTLQKAVDICRARESASANSAAILGDTASVTRVSAYRRSRARPYFDGAHRDDSCRRCGRSRHADGMRCPAMDASCHACGGLGHFASMCGVPSGRLSPGQPSRTLAAAGATGTVPGHVIARPAPGRPTGEGQGRAAAGVRGLARRQRPRTDPVSGRSSVISTWTNCPHAVRRGWK